MALSYTQLYDLVRRERSGQEVHELPGMFFEEAIYLLRELSQASQQGTLLESEQARVQLVNTRKLLKQIYELREQKIMALAQSRCKTGSAILDTGKLLPVERDLYEQLVTVLSAQRQQFAIDDLVTPASARPHKVEEEPLQATITDAVAVPETPERTTIRVVKAVPAFVGKGMETYGPYSENELVEVPDSVAQVLIRKGSASPKE